MTDNKWEQFAKSFEESNNYVVGIKDIQTVKSKLNLLSGTGNILELGCGNGTYTECFIESASSIVATDISDQMISITRDRFKDHKMVQIEKADCFNLPYQDSSFDTVFMANLLHVIPNPEIALSECFRVLKNDGRLFIASFTLHGMSFFNKIRLKFRYMRKYGAKSSSTIMLTPQLAENMTKSLGFQTITAELVGSKVKAVYLTAKKSHNI
ncbi:Methyltransferase type 11 [Moritella viscosa]|uniref:class I SAM-dependent methyltransferase n=1 Tax=Moritella viscosa TaxID=80854 RepID=UPI00091D0D56|nr:class I SAM-dependent methyltransferase [Moritella viscosa]SGY85261.1 Methyltransferase type 11 [Moritella viscosa]